MSGIDNNISFKINNNGIENNTVTNDTASAKNASQTIPLVQKYTEEELLKKLGITKDVLNSILLKYPDATSLPLDKLQVLVNKEIEANNLKENSEANIHNKDLESDNNIKSESNENSNSQETSELSDTQKPFDKGEFIKLSSEKKANVIALELAKNKFLYSDSANPKTEEDWNNLTEEERQNLFKSSLEAVKNDKNGLAKLLTNYGKSSIADSTMTRIQAANMYGISLEDFQKLSQVEREEYVYDYLNTEKVLADAEGRKPEFTKSERDYWNRSNLLAESVNNYYKQKGIERSVCPGDVSQVLREEKLNLEQIQFDYLDNKIKQGQNLSKYEKYQYKYLSETKDYFETDSQLNNLANEENQKLQEPPSLYSKIQSTEFAEKYNDAFPNEKVEILYGILKQEAGNDKKVLYDNLMASASDAYKKGDRALASDLAKKARLVDRVRYISVDKNASATEISLKTKSTKDLSVEEAVELHKNIGNNENEAIAEAGGIALVGRSSDEQALEISYVGSKFAKVDNAMYDRGTKVKDIENAEIIYTNVRNGATQETLNYVAANADKSQAELQNTVLKMYTEGNKEATQAAIDAKTVTRFYAQNQTEGLNTLKNNAETLMEKGEAIKALNLLSDQIQDCHKDNQLDMHKSMMQSKYSEVQEHTAGNIKNYDPTVQSQALDVVYTSGNEKAIEKAVTSLENAPSYIQEAELPRVIVETSIRNSQSSLNIITTDSDSNASLKSKIASGASLTPSEYNNLSSAEKKEYFTNYFKKLPLEQKIKLLSSIPNGAQKKTIYVMIARTDSNLFNAIMKDKDRADALLSMGLPNDVNNKIANVVKFLAVSDIGYQNIAKKHDIDYKNQDKQNHVSYNTNPYGFDSKELYRKDKNGNLVV